MRGETCSNLVTRVSLHNNLGSRYLVQGTLSKVLRSRETAKCKV